MRSKRGIATSVVLVIYVVLITVLSLVKFGDDVELPRIPHLDKIAHFCLYLGLNVLLLINISLRSKKLSIGGYLVATIFAIAYGILIELLQPYCGREGDLWDLMANVVGALCGVLIVRLLGNKIYFKQNQVKRFKH